MNIEALKDDLTQAHRMLGKLINHNTITVHGQSFQYVSSGKFSATYVSSKGTEYNVVPCQYQTVKNRPGASVYFLQNLKSKSKNHKMFAIWEGRFLDL